MKVKENVKTGEGVEQATFSSYDKTMTKNEVVNTKATNTTMGMHEGFQTRVEFKTS